MTKPLSLYQLAAFEAAARHLSFSRAADELNVQQPAIGRHVAALEADLGAALFIRTKPRLTLTSEGIMLSGVVTKGFEEIRNAISLIKNRSSDQTLVVNASIGFTSFFLLPKLAAFQELYPDIEVQIITRDQNPDFNKDEADLVITFGDEGIPNVETALINRVKMVAVCADNSLTQSTETLEELSRQKLLYLTSPEHIEDWQKFFAGSNITPTEPTTSDRYHSFMVYMRAIQDGMGVGIGWKPLIDEMLINGTLTLANARSVSDDRGYFCNIMPRALQKQSAHNFLKWVTSLDTAAQNR